MMKIEEILREAIQGEIESYELYTGAEKMIKAEHIKALLRDLAQEELGHRAVLERFLADPSQLARQVEILKAASVEDFKIGDHLVSAPLGPASTFQDVCIVASKKEKLSYELYMDLASEHSGEVRDLLEAMAKDELRHKNLVERWYEEVVYQEF